MDKHTNLLTLVLRRFEPREDDGIQALRRIAEGFHLQGGNDS